MSRVFRRGELRSAVLHVLADAGPANGYAVMQRLAGHIGGAWRPSPGAIYPALLALEDAGHIAGVDDDDGGCTYRITTSGIEACAARPGLLADLAHRDPPGGGTTMLAEVLAEFVRQTPRRTAGLDRSQAEAISAVLDCAHRRIAHILDQGSEP